MKLSLVTARVAVVVLAGAGFFVWHRQSPSGAGGPNDTQVVTSGAVPRTSAPATSTPSLAATPYSGPPADPFARTPADHWADGAAGITIPAAASHGPFTASEVAAAYATTRRLLIAQNLDHTTLLGGAPTAFADVLTAQQRAQFIAGLDKIGVDKKGFELSTRTWVASFAPGTTALIGTVIKAYGTMSARSAVDSGKTVLDVDVNYRFVYAVEPPRAPADWIRVVGQVTGYIEFNDWQDPGHTRTLLVNLPDPAAVAAEMVRLAKPGGWVASMEPDTEYVRCYPPHPAFDRAVRDLHRGLPPQWCRSVDRPTGTGALPPDGTGTRPGGGQGADVPAR